MSVAIVSAVSLVRSGARHWDRSRRASDSSDDVIVLADR